MEIGQIINTVVDFSLNYSFQIIGAVFILIIGFVAAKYVSAFFLKILERKKIDVTLSHFIVQIIKFTIIGFAAIAAMGKFGISIAPLVAALTALAFGASFAIQGPLSNYGAGIAIIISRPFVVGNTITIKDTSGIVKEISLGATVLIDEDGVEITIPNKHIVGEIIYNSQEWKIAEAVVGISYESNPEKAVNIIEKTLQDIEEVANNPTPQVGIQDFGDSSINIGYRYWVRMKSYYSIIYRANMSVYKSIKDAGINIPFPHREVRIISKTNIQE